MTDEPHDPGLTAVRDAIAANPVTLFMKGTPEAPQCGFSAVTASILNHLDVPFHAVDVLADDAVRDAVKRHGDWPTIPQLYLNGELLGGCDIVRTMFENGELRDAFANAGVAARASA